MLYTESKTEWIVFIHSALHDPVCDRMDEVKNVQEKSVNSNTFHMFYWSVHVDVYIHLRAAMTTRM